MLLASILSMLKPGPIWERAKQHTNAAGDGLVALNTALELDPQSIAANTFMALYWQRREIQKRRSKIYRLFLISILKTQLYWLKSVIY